MTAGEVVGVGVDLVDVQRFARLARPARWFTPDEVAACTASASSARAYAARFAVKEAAWKALGGPGRAAEPLPWPGIEVSSRPDGWAVVLDAPLAQVARGLGVTALRATVADAGRIVVAIVHALRG